MRMNGATKSSIASHLAESIVGATTIRDFGQEDGFFSKYLKLIDANACQYFHTSFADEYTTNKIQHSNPTTKPKNRKHPITPSTDLFSTEEISSPIAGDHPKPKPKKKLIHHNHHYPMKRDGKKKKGEEKEKGLGGERRSSGMK
ncbi:hypothetical protein LWI29_015354 [Acer saccharum]|uniref:Uncharacterized protein n=1 Tax=Acer saccharum TaxID=4024 RepID=A0AA39SDE1_ACESA|nr:hypothetical protein LWI29_015354 [Acer saccharum]